MLLIFISFAEYSIEGVTYISWAFFVIYAIFKFGKKIVFRIKFKNDAYSIIPEHLRELYEFRDFSRVSYPFRAKNGIEKEAIIFGQSPVFLYKKKKESPSYFPDCLVAPYPKVEEKDKWKKVRPLKYFYFWNEEFYKPKNTLSSPAEYFYTKKESPFKSSANDFLNEFKVKNKFLYYMKKIFSNNINLGFIILTPLAFYYELNFGFLFMAYFAFTICCFFIYVMIFKEKLLNRFNENLPKNIPNNVKVLSTKYNIPLQLFFYGGDTHSLSFVLNFENENLFKNRKLVINNDFFISKYRYQIPLDSKHRFNELISENDIDLNFENEEEKELYEKTVIDEKMLNIILNNKLDPLCLNEESIEMVKNELQEQLKREEELENKRKKEEIIKEEERKENEERLKKEQAKKERLENEADPVYIYNQYIDKLVEEHNKNVSEKGAVEVTDDIEFPSYILDKENADSMTEKFKIINEMGDNERNEALEESHFECYEKMSQELKKYNHTIEDFFRKKEIS